MNTEELLKKMSNIEKEGKSALLMRSEKAQEKAKAYRIPRLKKALKKKSKLLIPTDIAIPFNPKTGVADDTFNEDTKFRPALAAESVVKMCKIMAKENEDSKQAFIRGSGVLDWDLENPDEITEQDIKIFSRFKVPRIFTIPVVSVNIPLVTKSAYATKYSIEVNRDPVTGEIIGEEPGIFKINKIFRDKLYEEIQDFEDKIQSGELKLDDKQQKEERGHIWQKNPVSEDRPDNWIIAIELPLTNSYDLSADIDYSAMTADSVKGHVVISGYTKGMKDAIAKYLDGSWAKFDKSLNYYELDMSCPATGDESTNEGKMLLGKDTQFEKPSECIESQLDSDVLAVFDSAVVDYLDQAEDIETIVRRSTFIRPYTPELEEQLYKALPTVLNTEDKFFTKKVMEANREVMVLAYGGKGLDLLDEIDNGISDAADGKLDEDAAKAESKAYNLEAEEFAVDTEMVDFEE